MSKNPAAELSAFLQKTYKRATRVEVNVLAIVLIPLALWLGFSERVSWWLVLLVYALQFKVKVRIK